MPNMQPDRITMDWLEWVLITSVPLRRLDNHLVPIGIASGCLFDYGGKRFLLSVQHAIERTSTDWIMEIRYDPAKGTEVYRPACFNYIAEMTIGSGSMKSVDFCYAEIPNDLRPYYQYITPRNGIECERPRHVFGNFDVRASAGEVYAFAGQVLPERIGDAAICTEMRVYPGLRHIGTSDGYDIFKLPVPHPGHHEFKGCSGAPIVDTKKNVVALVCRGETEDNTIWGVPLSRYRMAFDFYVAN